MSESDTFETKMLVEKWIKAQSLRYLYNRVSFLNSRKVKFHFYFENRCANVDLRLAFYILLLCHSGKHVIKNSQYFLGPTMLSDLQARPTIS